MTYFFVISSQDHGGTSIIDGTKVEDTGEAGGSQLASIGYSCRICGKEAASDLALAHHLQSTHRQREMPYVCRICLFRSSLYEDILDHFKKVSLFYNKFSALSLSQINGQMNFTVILAWHFFHEWSPGITYVNLCGKCLNIIRLRPVIM